MLLCMNSLGETVRRLRKSHGWTQTQLAERSGVAQGVISRIESGAYKETPPPDVIDGLSDALGVPSSSMLQLLGYSIGESAPPYDELATSLAAVARKWTPAQRKAAWDLFVSIEAAMNANDPPVVDDDDNGLTATGD